MPPPAPAFLPSNRRVQRLDPTRHLQSRELWNQVRFHASAFHYANDCVRDDDGSSNNGTSSSSGWFGPAFNRNNMQWAISLLRAVLYEIQPFRIKPTLLHMQLFLQEGGWKRCASTLRSQVKYMVAVVLKIIKLIHQCIRSIDVRSIASLAVAHKILLAKSIVAFIGLRLYYRTVLYLHDLLAAGPLVIIFTLFILLYTIGLGDNTGASSGIPSAYSVFNRGVQRILGTVDGEELARQFAGGMAAVRGGGGVFIRNRIDNDNNDDVGGIWMMNHDNGRNRERDREEDEDDPQNDNLINERRRKRRLERRQQQQRLVDDDEDEENDVPPRLVDNNDENYFVDGDDNFNRGGGGVATARSDTAAAGEGGRGGGARKSGKKARRKNNVEVRRELQLQRQAAAVLGFGGGMDGGVLLEEVLGLDDDMQIFDE